MKSIMVGRNTEKKKNIYIYNNKKKKKINNKKIVIKLLTIGFFCDPLTR